MMTQTSNSRRITQKMLTTFCTKKGEEKTTGDYCWKLNLFTVNSSLILRGYRRNDRSV